VAGSGWSVYARELGKSVRQPLGDRVPTLREADLLILGASEIVTCRGPARGIAGAGLERLETIEDGAIAIGDGRILAVGPTREIEAAYRAGTRIDAEGRLVSPGLIDPHSHLIFAGDRCAEYEEKILGRIVGANLERGIAVTIKATHAASDRALVEQALRDLDIALAHGTTTIEAKTGYGLDRESELRLLRLTAGLEHAIEVVPTFLGAHVVPDDYASRRGDYVQLLIDMTPEVAGLAEYCDVSCDPSCFTVEECLRMGEAARRHGMGIRVHADQTGDGGGAALAARLGAASADHLDHARVEGLRAMAEAGTVAVFLPAVTFHLMEMTPPVEGGDLGSPQKPFMPLAVRRAIEAGAVVALSADYNPGSAPTPSMQIVMQLAARLYRLTYAQIWHMCTLNAAASLGRGHDRGSLEPGKRADVVIWTEPDHRRIVNRFGYNMVDRVLIEGRTVVRDGRPVEPTDRRTAT
jgi:imidazolonepropionase